MTRRARHLVLTVLAPFAAGYFLSYMFRAINAVVAPDLVRDIGLTASELGLLTAAYLVAFAVFQLPLGVLLDRFGPRRVQAGLLLIAATGSVLFSLGSNALTLTLARALIGLGFAGGLMAGFKAVVLWYRPERHALANACIMSFGGVGMLAATVPAEMTVQAVGWRGLFLLAAALTVAVAVVIYTVVPEKEAGAAAAPLARQLGHLATVLRDRFFWRLAPLVALTAGAQVGIHTLWAGPWFRDVAGFDRDGVALHLFYIGVAFLIGTLLQGIIADRLGRRGIDALQVMLAGNVVFLLCQLAIIIGRPHWPATLWIVFGMTGQIAILAYARLAAHFGAVLSGRAQTAINLLVFLAAFVVQYVIGAIIDLFPAGVGDGYAISGYRWGFGVFLALQTLALAWYVLPRQGVGRPQ